MSYDSYILPLIEKKISFPLKITGDSFGSIIIGCLLRIIESLYEHKPGYDIEIMAEFYQILYICISSGKMETKRRSFTVTDNVRVDSFKSVIAYIRDHYMQRINISDMAKVANMSPNYFCHYFKSLSKMTPVEYLNNFRMNRAADLLRQTDKKITAVSLDIGFYNISYFNKLFKQAKGCTPVAFRKQNSILGNPTDQFDFTNKAETLYNNE